MKHQSTTVLTFVFNTAILLTALTLILGMLFTMAAGLRWFSDWLLELSDTPAFLRIVTSSVLYLSLMCVGVTATAATVLGIRKLQRDTFGKTPYKEQRKARRKETRAPWEQREPAG